MAVANEARYSQHCQVNCDLYINCRSIGPTTAGPAMAVPVLTLHKCAWACTKAQALERDQRSPQSRSHWDLQSSYVWNLQHKGAMMSPSW